MKTVAKGAHTWNTLGNMGKGKGGIMLHFDSVSCFLDVSFALTCHRLACQWLVVMMLYN